MPVNNRIALRFFKFWFPVYAWMGFIFYVSSLSAEDIPSLFTFQDVLYHLFVYIILAYFFSRALKNTYARLTSIKILVLTLIFSITYGVSDELHQIFVPQRCASVLDLFIDGLGGFIGSLLYR